MGIKEEKRDLFSVGPDYFLAHCISADFALGKGIAVEFAKRGVKEILQKHFPGGFWSGEGYLITTGLNGFKGCFNLVTKEKYWYKPTYKTITESLESLKHYVEQILNHEDSVKIAMPRIGCGLDRLDWEKVKVIINDTFKNFSDDELEILICSL